MKPSDSMKTPTRRALLRSGLGAGTLLARPFAAFATAPPGFDQWRDGFRARALTKGISEATWTRVMGRIEPNMSVFKQMQKQPEFNEKIWQYINRRVSDWRIIAGKEALKKNEALAALAWNEPRRRTYWETELINALKIVDRGWSTPEEMRGSWAGAMGHTQWMPEVWLNVGMDYDKDGRV